MNTVYFPAYGQDLNSLVFYLKNRWINRVTSNPLFIVSFFFRFFRIKNCKATKLSRIITLPLQRTDLSEVL